MDDHAIDSGPTDGIERASLPATIETADAGDDGKRRIRGYANTFGVMRSGRIIHPQAVEDWLRANPDARLKLLALHGFVDGFATIGVIEKLKVQRAKGLYFEGTLASGIELADQAWELIRQRMLSSLSVGWVAKQRRWVRADDRDLDPWFAKKMKEAGVTEALAFIDVEIVEISLVDVGDDAGAKLAAKAGGAAIEAAIAPLRQELAALRAEVATLKAAGGSGDAAQLLTALREHSAEFLEDLKDAAIEALQSEPAIRSAALGLQEEVRELVADAGDDGASLHERISELGGKE